MDWKNLLKILTGLVVVPISIIAGIVWGWWEKATLTEKILTAPLVFPIIGIAFFVTPWWNDL